MKQIIGGLTYNTETAHEIGAIGSHGGISRRDFDWWEAVLYRTRKARYFMAGRGNASSPFAMPYGRNGSQAGDGIRVLSEEEARAYAEKYMDADTIAANFRTEEA